MILLGGESLVYWLIDILVWIFVGFPVIYYSDYMSAKRIERETGRLKTQIATFEILQKLAKKRGYKRIAKQAIQAIKETEVAEEPKENA
jgi:hypothetical protein